ncbi:hypothetical protein [Coleofasciculus sp.]|uniref:hypothetical protein n=1 Tax=Coleofasciculus sp. TaxID=3100458 RepID=UPI003A2A72BD
MAQFPLQDTHQITQPLVQDIYDEISAELGFGMVPNLFKSMAIRSEFLSTTWKQFRSTILKIDMYQVKRLKADFATDPLGLVPNETFNKIYLKMSSLAVQ